MVELGNGRSQAKPEQPKPRLRFTGQRLTLLRPETEPRQQVLYHHICRKLRVSEHTLKAIEKAESLSIAEKKQRLLERALRIASKAADRVEDQIDGEHYPGHCRVRRGYRENNAAFERDRRRITSASEFAGECVNVTRQIWRCGMIDLQSGDELPKAI